eukprot:144354-Prymnesium_polylepis.2
MAGRELSGCLSEQGRTGLKKRVYTRGYPGAFLPHGASSTWYGSLRGLPVIGRRVLQGAEPRTVHKHTDPSRTAAPQAQPMSRMQSENTVG